MPINCKDEFKNKTLVITGGTGSFGNAIVKRFIDLGLKEIRVFSRDEKKQDDMRKFYQRDNISFYLGDIRDVNSVKKALKGANYVFHAAAFKQVPSCEFFPIEAFKTNVLGTENILRESINSGVSKVVCLSTDKAVYPINAMGLSKAMMEKVLVAESRDMKPDQTVICGTRYGNVMGSRGSVIPLFLSQIKNKIPITITNSSMTRFMMSLEESIDLVIYAFIHGKNGDLFVQKSPSSTVENLVKALLDILDKKNYPVETIGTRHGEKLFETLVSREEMIKAEDMGNYYRIPSDSRDLNYKIYYESGNSLGKSVLKIEEYNSNNTDILNQFQMKEILLRLDFIKSFIKNNNV